MCEYQKLTQTKNGAAVAAPVVTPQYHRCCMRFQRDGKVKPLRCFGRCGWCPMQS